MLLLTARLVAALVFASAFVCADDDDKGRKNPERQLQKLELRAEKLSKPDADERSRFMARETGRLVERTRALSRSSYEFERMLEAIEDLVDAREDLAASRDGQDDEEERGRKEDEQEKTSKRLERAYFRVQQAGYFAQLSADRQASEYVLRSRQLYQQARAAYDKRDFYRANKLASAGSELVNVLENLAQAAVRKPEPPVLK